MHAADLLSSRARLTPDREALFDQNSGLRYSYAQLNRRANQAANFLHHEFNVQKGDRVSILAQNCLAYVDLVYGLAKIGAIFAPLNWRLTARELAYIVNDCQPKVLICGPDHAATLEEMRPSLSVQHYLSLENAQIPDASTYEDNLAQASPLEPERPHLDGEDPYCILYTSGTTGRPKGAILPHRQVIWNAINTVISWGLSEHDVSPILTPMFHSGGLFVFLVPLHYVGGRIVLARNFEVEESLQTIQEEKCTVILGVPTMFQIWMSSPLFAEADFRSVHFFISGGAPCPVPLMEAWRTAKNVVFRQGYGLTEVGTNCFSMTDEEATRKAGSVGKPIFHSQMRLVGADNRDVVPGETGELLIKGPHVSLGYWNNPEATYQALVDGWFHTGDMARQDGQGFFYIVGRYKDMIISGGENIYAAEVEAVFRQHPAVADAALIGHPDEKWGEIGVMIVVLKPGMPVDETTLQDFCREHLARFKVPKRVIFAESLPYSPYGKVIKAELKKLYVR